MERFHKREVRKKKRFLRPIPEIGECFWHLRPQSVGKNEVDTRWEQGEFAGSREKSGELYVVTKRGALKDRDQAQT